MKKYSRISELYFILIVGLDSLSFKDKFEITPPLYSGGNEISLNGIWKFKYDA